MLLRSITKHVREQNWFAVALDFFIVVVGIITAFPIGVVRALLSFSTMPRRRSAA